MRPLQGYPAVPTADAVFIGGRPCIFCISPCNAVRLKSVQYFVEQANHADYFFLADC